jgi:spore coat protein JB
MGPVKDRNLVILIFQGEVFPMAAANERMLCLRKIQELEFTALELNLYLDTHPEDGKAIEHFNRISDELMQQKYQYEQYYGPLLSYGFGRNNGNTWRWVECPWPWEM